MRNSISLICLAAIPLVSAYTFSFQTSQNKVNFGGSNTVKCELFAYTSDDPDQYSDDPDATTEIKCAGGCGTLNINGKDWEGCIEGINDLDLSGTATIKEGESTTTVWPGGQSSSQVDTNPLASGRYHFFWLNNVEC